MGFERSIFLIDGRVQYIWAFSTKTSQWRIMGSRPGALLHTLAYDESTDQFFGTSRESGSTNGSQNLFSLTSDFEIIYAVQIVGNSQANSDVEKLYWAPDGLMLLSFSRSYNSYKLETVTFIDSCTGHRWNLPFTAN